MKIKDKIFFENGSVIIISKKALNTISFLGGFITRGLNGSSWGFLIFFRDWCYFLNCAYINHEKIHNKQWKELGLIFFPIWYFFEYLFYRARGFSHIESYLLVSFEQEAYAYENEPHYLNKRKPFAFFRFLKMKNKKSIETRKKTLKINENKNA